MNNYKQPKNAIKFTNDNNKIRGHITCPICMELIQHQFTLPFNWIPKNDKEVELFYQVIAAMLNKELVKHIHSHYGIDNWGHVKLVQLDMKEPLYTHVVQLVKNRVKRMTFLQRLKFLITRKIQTL